VEEIVRLSDAHEASAPVESGAGDQAVDMGMKFQVWRTAVKPLVAARSPSAMAGFRVCDFDTAAKNRS